MRLLNPTRMALPALMLAFSSHGVSQGPAGKGRTADIAVNVVGTFGEAIGGAKIDSFVDEQGRDRVSLFHGLAANGVPFGQYRITVQAGDRYSSTLLVEVAAPNVLVTVGLEWPGLVGRVTGRLQGRLDRFPSTWGDWWCKASGLYTRLEYESAVTPPGLQFDFGRVPSGIYVVTCVANGKFFAVRTVRVAGDAAPFTLEYKPGEDREAVSASP